MCSKVKKELKYSPKDSSKKLNGCIAKSFRKIMPVKKKEDSIELYDRLRSLKGKNDDKSKKEVEEIQIK